MQILIAIALLLILGLLLYVAARLKTGTPGHDELIRLQIENTRLRSDLEHERQNATEKLQLLQTAENRLKTEFENLANRIFEDKGKAFSEQSRERIGSLLLPLKDQIDAFRKRVDEVHRHDTEQSARLVEQVRSLHELSNKVSEEANNLASAIKGDTKTQGDWGELVMERIFEAAGLERGREYEIQVAMRSADGALQKPDFMLTLPGGKAIILDAKVSLTAYARGAAAGDEASRAAAIREHVQSVRRHIEELRNRHYDDLLGNRTLDFVIMCIPLEPAYQAALQADPEILYDLARTNVVLTGPATLMITLKLIAQIWRREHENRNAEAIAEKAGRMHDQVALVYEAMEDAGKRLTGTAEAFALAMNRLKDGRGNLITRALELRRLGAKVSKTLPEGKTED